MSCRASPRRYAIQNGLFISRCASQRVIPMSRKVASLNPCSSRRERVRRCHSEIRNFSWYTMVAAFDGGLVSFADDGAVLISDQVGDAARGALGITPTTRLPGLRDRQRAKSGS